MSRTRAVRLGVIVSALAVVGCEQPNTTQLFGQRTPTSAPDDGSGAGQRPGDNDEAARLVQEHVSGRPRPHRRTADGEVVSMGARSLDESPEPRRRHPAARGTAPSVEWISVAGVESQVVPLSAEPALEANTPAVSHSQPVVTVDPIIARLEMAVHNDPNDIEAQMRLRHVYLANGWRDKALMPPDGMDPERAEVLMTWARALVEGEELIRSPTLSVDSAHRFAALQETVRNKSQLEIPRIALCSTIHSYGRYEVIPDGFLVAGGNNRVLIYCEVTNFGAVLTEDGHETRIAHRLELFDPAGRIVWQDDDFLEVVDHCANRRTDFFFNRFWQLPPGLTAGEYVLNVIVADRTKSQMTEAKHTVNILSASTSARR